MRRDRTLSAFIICLVAVAVTPRPASPLSPFEKWRLPSHFRGYNIEQNGWSEMRQDFLNADDFVDLRATGANLVSLNIEGTWTDTFPYGPNYLPPEGGGLT